MKAEDAGPHCSTEAKDVEIASVIARKLVSDAVGDLAQMLMPIVPQGKTISISTALCIMFKATVEGMVALDREATNAFLLAVSDGLNGTGDNVSARQLAAQDAFARAEIIKEAKATSRGLA